MAELYQRRIVFWHGEDKEFVWLAIWLEINLKKYRKVTAWILKDSRRLRYACEEKY